MVISIEVVNTALLLIGSYDPNKVDERGLRETEIKGLWRWWVRAFVAGALYNSGYIHGQKGDKIVIKPREDEAKLISCLTGKVFGLGTALENIAEASRFRIWIEPKRKSDIVRLSEDKKRRLSRIKLLTLGCNIVEAYEKNSEFVINVERCRTDTRYREAEYLALKILVLALQFMGIGKGSRRGLGSLDIVSIEARDPAEHERELVNKILGYRNNMGKFIEEVYRECNNVVNKYAEEACIEKLRLDIKKSEKSGMLPPMPLISNSPIGGLGQEALHAANFYRIECGNRCEDVFTRVHNFVVRGERCKVIKCKPKYMDELREKYRAWILGLPRGQKNTGYMIEEGTEISRRASPLTLALHTDRNIFGKGVYIALLVSGDWPSRLRWRGEEEGSISVDEQEIKNAYITLMNEFKNYLTKLSIELKRIWPLGVAT